ncbi:MAG: 30S ribosomal protein S2 [Patescibacteria group bacterium]
MTKERVATVPLPTLEEMLKAGVHFGHQASRRHPKMSKFIFTKRNNVHVIDLSKTRDRLQAALDCAAQIAGNGGVILFVGSKKQASVSVRAAAERCGMPYIVGRWIGGLFTNFEQVSKLIKKLDRLEVEERDGTWKKYKKSEQMGFKKEQEKLKKFVGGIRTMTKLPKAVYIVDIKKEKTAVAESNKKNIPLIAMTDTNVNPDLVQYPIPANDDAVSSITMITNLIADAIEAAKKTVTVTEPVSQK